MYYQISVSKANVTAGFGIGSSQHFQGIHSHVELELEVLSGNGLGCCSEGLDALCWSSELARLLVDEASHGVGGEGGQGVLCEALECSLAGLGAHQAAGGRLHDAGAELLGQASEDAADGLQVLLGGDTFRKGGPELLLEVLIRHLTGDRVADDGREPSADDRRERTGDPEERGDEWHVLLLRLTVAAPAGLPADAESLTAGDLLLAPDHLGLVSERVLPLEVLLLQHVVEFLSGGAFVISAVEDLSDARRHSRL